METPALIVATAPAKLRRKTRPAVGDKQFGRSSITNGSVCIFHQRQVMLLGPEGAETSTSSSSVTSVPT